MTASRRRRRERGAMMVEALIVLGFTMVFFASGIYLFNGYNAKLESFSRATAQAFQQASSGCGSALGSYSVQHLITLAPPDPLSDNPDPAFLGGAASTTNVQVSFSGTTPAPLGGGGWTVGSTAKVACNEPTMTRAQALAALGVDDWAVDGVMGASGL